VSGHPVGPAVAGVPKEGKGGTLQVKCVRIRVKAVAKQVLMLLKNYFKVKIVESNTFFILKFKILQLQVSGTKNANKHSLYYK
jgi:hypothetical protein